MYRSGVAAESEVQDIHVQAPHETRCALLLSHQRGAALAPKRRNGDRHFHGGLCGLPTWYDTCCAVYNSIVTIYVSKIQCSIFSFLDIRFCAVASVRVHECLIEKQVDSTR